MMASAPSFRKVVEYYTIDLAQLPEGGYRISMLATTVDDEDPQLLCQELVNARVATIDDVLTVIREGVSGTGT